MTHESLDDILEEAAELLPQQSPLHMFVHHNTLHAFEHLPFEEAVLEAASRFGTEPYQTEQAFALSMQKGRIRPSDIEAVLAETTSECDERVIPGGPTRIELRALRLNNIFEVPSGEALLWSLEETGTLFRFDHRVAAPARAAMLRSAQRMSVDVHEVSPREREEQVLERLWKELLAVAPMTSVTACGRRWRDRLLASFGVDTDHDVHPMLIRFCAAFVDQGVAYWQMPGREHGLLHAFRELYGLGDGLKDRWLSGFAAELRAQSAEGWSAEDTVRWALDQLEVPRSQWQLYIEETLLSLPGWAGMMRQLELRPDTAPVSPPKARLMDYLALQLTLDWQAARVLIRERLRASATFADLSSEPSPGTPRPELELVYEGFMMAQLAGLGPAEIAGPELAKRWLDEVGAFDSNARRRVLHRAYERKHRIGVLDGIVAHCRLSRETPATRPRFQGVFCIDDREESLRRHLEELRADVETLGYAGFFGVAMAYQAVDEIRPRPLCPVAVRPTHYVSERPLDADAARAFTDARRRQGQLSHSFSLGSRMLARGGLLSALFGILSVIPLLGRALFPRRTERLAHWVAHRAAPLPATRLCLERTQEQRSDGLASGYTVEEMAGVVAGVLKTIGKERDLAPLVLIVGHGSSSLNNPHEAAYDCGATGGGRGGPNARAFAEMANDPRVRARVRALGVVIPEDTWFVGTFHNTSDDSMAYYDEALLPAHLDAELAELKGALERACQLDAQERCRRFESAPLSLSPKAALIHAEARAHDLAQPRPELGHATNALCIVGRRSRTRGLFLDRRAFLVSYDPTQDPSGETLASLLSSVGPVGAGINLEYYFSFVDRAGYGAGTKLPHNIVGLIGVMDGHASDLRTGLPWQMVEIHEPVRLLTIVEAKPALLERLIDQNPGLARLIKNGWIQLVSWDPEGESMAVYQNGEFQAYQPENPTIAVVERSSQFFSGKRGDLSCAHVTAGLSEVA